MGIKYIKNSFFEVFSINTTAFGVISLGYFNAFKSIDLLEPREKAIVQKNLIRLFNKSSIVAGDLNSTPFKINEFLERNSLKGFVLSTPSYLFPKKYVRKEVDLPAFDNFIIFDKSIKKYSINSLIKLPEKIKINPRRYMKQIGSPSDHIPVTGKFNKKGINIKISIYNIADPVFWGKYYESAKQGFDVSEKGEAKRQIILSKLVVKVVKTSDLSFLTEVPESFIEDIKEISKKLNKEILIKDTLHSGKMLQGISKNVLIYDKNFK